MAVMIETLRNAAGVMFWAFVDLILSAMWLAFIFGLLLTLVTGIRSNDEDK